MLHLFFLRSGSLCRVQGVCVFSNAPTSSPAMKRRTERTLHNDLNSNRNRIVRRKGHRTPSPPPVDTRRREVRDSSLSYDKYDRPSAKSSDDRMVKPPIERPHYSKESAAGPSSGPSRPFAEKFEYSLRITNLDYNRPDTEMKEALFQDFKKFGFINVKVLGYGKDRHAFINFAREAGARRARRDMQGHVIFGIPLHLEWSKTTLTKLAELSAEPARRRSVSREESPVYDDYLYRRRGDDFSDHESRDVSYWSSHHHRHHQSPIPTLPELPKSTFVEPNATRTLFVGNLEVDITEKELRDLFGGYGRIETIDIKTQRSTGTAYAFIKFVTINDAINAKNDMHSRQYGNFRLKIGFGKGSPTAKIWLGNLTSYADVSEIRHELDRFGLIRRVDYTEGDNHAFVHFDSLDAAQTAVNTLTGYRFKTTNLPLKIDLSRYNHVRSDFDDNDAMEWHERGGPHSHDKRPAVTDDSSYRRKLRDREARFRGDANGKQTPPPMPPHYRGNKQEELGDDMRGEGEYERSVRRKRPRTPPLPPPPPEHHDSVHKHRHSSVDSQNGDHAYRSKRPKSSFGEEREKSSHSDHVTPSAYKNRTSSSSEVNRYSPSDHHHERHSSEATDSKKPTEKSKGSHALTEAIPTVTDLATADTALKLSGTTEPISPDSEKSVKPDAGLPESLSDLAKLYPVAWRGNLVLKNTGFPTRMHLVGGDPAVAETLLRSKEDSYTLRITQRLRLEPPRLEEVNKRMLTAGPGGHCIMLALPGPTPNQSSPEQSGDNSMQLRPLRSLVSYLKQKEAAGIVALSPGDACSDSMAEKDLSKDVIGVLHAFPPCLFSQQQLLKIAPNLGSEPSKEDHIVVLLVKGTV